jgi:hypothetical protein
MLDIVLPLEQLLHSCKLYLPAHQVVRVDCRRLLCGQHLHMEQAIVREINNAFAQGDWRNQFANHELLTSR